VATIDWTHFGLEEGETIILSPTRREPHGGRMF
jgi:hypothetical protein